MNINHAFALFLEQLKGQSPANRNNYHRRLTPFLEQHGHRNPTDLTRADINAWHSQLLDHGYASASRAGYIQALKHFLRFCVREGWLPCSPADHLLQPSFISPRDKCPPEYAVIACTRLAWAWTTEGDLIKKRQAAAYLLSAETGARLGALLNLRRSSAWQALNHPPNQYGIYTALSWSKGREYQLDFSFVAARALRAYLEKTADTNAPDRVFLTTRPSTTVDDPQPRIRHINARRLTTDIETVCKAANVPVHRTHALRHRLGTLITKQFDPKIAAMKLNHSDANTTAATAIAYYYHPSRDAVHQATAQLAPRVHVDIAAHVRSSDF